MSLPHWKFSTMNPDTAAAILVDANLLLWAHHRRFSRHRAAREWWADTLSTVAAVGIPWPVILAFVRISTHPRALTRPVLIDEAWGVVAGWLGRPNVEVPVPTQRHAAILEDMLVRGGASGNHTSDAHLAALSIEHGLELQSADRDFARYPGLRWRNPLM
jgi:toxin-antitoxin system PIN domain toxin